MTTTLAPSPLEAVHAHTEIERGSDTAERGSINGLAKLRDPFPPEKISKLPKRQKQPDGSYKEIELDYVGHADVTERLLNADPHWNWEPMGFAPDGLPAMITSANGQPIGLWIRLTVCGVTRIGFGSVTPGAFDAEKQLIGDAIRNAAMRFGVALDLWRKEAPPENNHADARAPAARPETGEGSLCKQCAEEGYVSTMGHAPTFRKSKRGNLQCNGRMDEIGDNGEKGWANHPFPLAAGEEFSDDTPIPFA